MPSKDAYSSMMKKLLENQSEIDAMFEKLIEELKNYLPEFGKHLAIDSKKIETFAKGKKDPKESADTEADWGHKI